ncbi:MAG: hypothetical protein K6G15_11050 [Desulfovibrio sp.]|nr:hypothetical protein [Desulfovibrio sp.]
MPYLQSLDEIEDIENLTHRAVLQAVRDTTFNMAEIAKRLKIHIVTAYHIVRQYLPEGFIRKRTQMLQLKRGSMEIGEKYSPDDLVHVIPADNMPSSTHPAALPTASAEGLSPKASDVIASQDAQNKQNLPPDAYQSCPECTPSVVHHSTTMTQTKNILSVQHGNFTLKWEGDNDPRPLESFCCVMKEFLTILGTKS